jgi:predicted DNA-binding transcriptional regulator AlpA
MTTNAFKPRDVVLPPSLAPRGLRRVEAAAYIGVSPTLFDWMIAQGTMPKPKRVGGRVIWDRLLLDEYFAAIPSDDDKPPKPPKPSVWDDVA